MAESDFGGGIGDIFKGIGDFAEASDYDKAAALANQNASLALQSGKIQQAQEQRKLFQVTGQESAATGGGNFAAGGSALDVVRNSLQQSGLQHQIIGLQADVEANSFTQQAEAYKGQANSAQLAGVGSFVNSIFDFIPH